MHESMKKKQKSLRGISPLVSQCCQYRSRIAQFSNPQYCTHKVVEEKTTKNMKALEKGYNFTFTTLATKILEESEGEKKNLPGLTCYFR